MKKFTKVFALLAGSILSFAAVGFSACDILASISSGGEGDPETTITGEGDPETTITGEGDPETTITGEGDPETTMTKENVQTVNSAFTAMDDYSGGYTINETSVTELKYDNEMFAEYEGGITTEAVVTYDQSTGNMAYEATLAGTGVYSSLVNMNMEVGYYTVKNSDTDYTQYAKIIYGTTNSKTATNYTIAPTSCYYADYSSCLGELFGIDLSKGAECVTVEDYALFFENKLDDSISRFSDTYGLTFDFEADNCEVITEGNDTIYRFTASATASLSYEGSTVADKVKYTADVYLDTTDASNIKISKLNLTLEQELTATAEGVTVTATSKTTTSDVFTYTYDSSAMPTDFSDYVSTDI